MLTSTRCHHLLISALCLACFLPLLYQSSAHAKTAAQFLAEAPAPQFKSGHTLPRLTRWGWWMSYEARVELCQRWGYALEWVELSGNDMDDPNSIASRVCTLSAADPQRYPLAVIAPRPFQDPAFIASLPESAWCHDATGVRTKRLSPIMPDEVYLRAGAVSAMTMTRIRKICPIAIVLNGGEYGVDVYGWGGADWEKDPAVVAAKGTRSWFEFISERKAHYESLVANATKAAAPGLQEYIYYYTDGGLDRHRYDFWWQWVWDYRYMRHVSTRPNSSLYYLEFNSGWAGSIDLLTQALNATGAQIAQGDPLAYNWVCSGWIDGKFADDQRYMGFLKSLYTTGMIGAVAGYFSYPSTGFTGDLGPTPPSWLIQLQTLSHAHGLFSYLEDYLRNGDLLPGPNTHRWSTDLPAYEFPTGDETARVLARKLRGKSEWMICAWAAAGPDRQVTVTIPELGVVNVLARATGTMYRALPGPTLKLLDPDGMHPTANLQTIKVYCGSHGTINTNATVTTPTGGSETFVFTPAPGYQVADVKVDGQSVDVCLSYTFENVVANHILYVTFAPAPPSVATVSVHSQPAGIAISGVPSGITPYVSLLSLDTVCTLIAPVRVMVDGISHTFVQWISNGISQPIGQTTLQGYLDSAGATALAIYQTLPINTAPVALGRTFTTSVNQGFPFSLIATDAEKDALTYTIVTPPTQGFLGAGETPGLFFFMPKKDYFGTDTFTYKANDGKIDSSVATVSITVTPVNHAPVATSQSFVANKNRSIRITLTGTDVESNTLTFLRTSNPRYGRLYGSLPQLTYVPRFNYVGPDSFKFIVNDGKIDSVPATISIIIK